MSNKTILITGGTGLVGSALTKELLKRGYKVCFLSTRPQAVKNVPAFKWDISQDFMEPEALDGVDIIVHLAGANISEKRWTRKQKKLIYDSRVEGARLILRNVIYGKKKIKAFISSSGVGYYGTFTSDKILTEDNPAGDDFLAYVAENWEKAAWEFYKYGIRVGIIRTGVVLAANGGIIKRLYPLARLGILSPIGSGKQYVPWIHIDNLVRMYIFLIENEISDVFNGVAPDFITFEQFIKGLMQALNKRVIMPNVPALLVKLLFGEMSIIMLYGSRVSADKIIKAGFEFKFPKFSQAIADIVQQLKSK